MINFLAQAGALALLLSAGFRLCWALLTDEGVAGPALLATGAGAVVVGNNTLPPATVAVILSKALLPLAVAALAVVTYRRVRQARLDEKQRIAALEERHDKVIDAWGAHLTDVEARMRRPEIEDPNRAETEAFLAAYTEAAERREIASENITKYSSAVRWLETTWMKANA